LFTIGPRLSFFSCAVVLFIGLFAITDIITILGGDVWAFVRGLVIAGKNIHKLDCVVVAIIRDATLNWTGCRICFGKDVVVHIQCDGELIGGLITVSGVGGAIRNLKILHSLTGLFTFRSISVFC